MGARLPVIMMAGHGDIPTPARAMKAGAVDFPTKPFREMARATFRKQSQAPSRTVFKEFAGRSHWICMNGGWEQIADYALDFAVKNARARNVSPIRNAA